MYILDAVRNVFRNIAIMIIKLSYFKVYYVLSDIRTSIIGSGHHTNKQNEKSIHAIIIVEIRKLPDEMSDLEDFDHVFEQENRRNITRHRCRCIR
ncbi:hypothetical protein L9F63_013760, partial [Diploptera punctata]